MAPLQRAAFLSPVSGEKKFLSSRRCLYFMSIMDACAREKLLAGQCRQRIDQRDMETSCATWCPGIGPFPGDAHKGRGEDGCLKSILAAYRLKGSNELRCHAAGAGYLRHAWTSILHIRISVP